MVIECVILISVGVGISISPVFIRFVSLFARGLLVVTVPESRVRLRRRKLLLAKKIVPAIGAVRVILALSRPTNHEQRARQSE
jgi:hypothetical protein